MNTAPPEETNRREAPEVYQLPPGPPRRTWTISHGTYLAGRAEIDEVDEMAIAMDAKWGVGRLRLIVPAGLREKFDRQRYKQNQAIWHGTLEDVREQCRRMLTAYRVLDTSATAAGLEPMAPEVWEVALPDGSVAALVRTDEDLQKALPGGRKMLVFSLTEIAHLLAQHPELVQVKAMFPGATVQGVRPLPDPMHMVQDTFRDIDEALDDEIPF